MQELCPAKCQEEFVHRHGFNSSRPTIGPKRSLTVEAKRVYGILLPIGFPLQSYVIRWTQPRLPTTPIPKPHPPPPFIIVLSKFNALDVLQHSHPACRRSTSTAPTPPPIHRPLFIVILAVTVSLCHCVTVSLGCFFFMFHVPSLGMPQVSSLD